MNKMIYLVVGSSGEYTEDYQEWIVCAYTDKDKADHHAAMANDDPQENDPYVTAHAHKIGGYYSAKYSVEEVALHVSTDTTWQRMLEYANEVAHD